jgi:hypothetical protein
MNKKIKQVAVKPWSATVERYLKHKKTQHDFYLDQPVKKTIQRL